MAAAKSVYISGPLTELAPCEQERVKRLYVRMADVAERVLGVRGFVPHEHFDPIANAGATPAEVDAVERKQVCECTSCLVVLAEAPSWGGGIEVEMAHRSGVPVLVFCNREKLEQRRISRLLRGNPAVIGVYPFNEDEELLDTLAVQLAKLSRR